MRCTTLNFRQRYSDLYVRVDPEIEPTVAIAGFNFYAFDSRERTNGLLLSTIVAPAANRAMEPTLLRIRRRDSYSIGDTASKLVVSAHE